jgi:hypothetical protein
VGTDGPNGCRAQAAKVTKKYVSIFCEIYVKISKEIRYLPYNQRLHVTDE